MRILTVDIGGTSIKMACVSADGTITQFQEVPTESEKGGLYIVEKVSLLMKSYNDYDAIGISTAGQVDTTTGTIIFANPNIPRYTGTPLKQIFEERFQVPVKVENDVNAAAIGEHIFGAGKECSNFLCLTYGTGIGGAIIIDDKIYRGPNGIAAEFGHILCQSLDGKPVYYEHVASTRALIKKAQQIMPTIENGRQLFEQYEAQPKLLKPTIDEWINDVVFGLVSLIHCFNPSTIILGGGVMERHDLIEVISKHVKANVMPSFADVTIQKAILGNKAGLLGAAALHL